MLTNLRQRLTYANVMSTLAVFIALGYLASAAVRDPRTAAGIAIGFWLFFVLKDREGVSDRASGALPPAWRADTVNVLAILGSVGGRWVRGEFLLGIAVFIATLGFQIAHLGQFGFGYGAYIGFAAAGLLALVAGLAGMVVQVIAWTQQSFGPADGGFASVYFGWTAFMFLFILGTLFWLETTLATSFRYARVEFPGVPGPGQASGDAYRAGSDIRDPLSLVRAELTALSFYWTFLAGIAVLTWIILDLL